MAIRLKTDRHLATNWSPKVCESLGDCCFHFGRAIWKVWTHQVRCERTEHCQKSDRDQKEWVSWFQTSGFSNILLVHHNLAILCMHVQRLIHPKQFLWLNQCQSFLRGLVMPIWFADSGIWARSMPKWNLPRQRALSNNGRMEISTPVACMPGTRCSKVTTAEVAARFFSWNYLISTMLFVCAFFSRCKDKQSAVSIKG